MRQAPMPIRSSLGAPVEFLRLLWAVDHGLQSASKRMAQSLGVTGPQRLVIRIVGRRPGISPGELAGILHVHPSTLTGVLSRLVAHGLLARRGDTRDRRRMILTLTEKGKAINRSTAGTVEAGVRRMLGSISRPDLEASERVLRRLAADLAEQSMSWSR
ncbi:MAG TPA: MarR family transcriptional regulator [Thermoanaerobaculia bacterium]|nr:MarR family transcriptional regulator [Thermoanaerobaculia bacterium]